MKVISTSLNGENAPHVAMLSRKGFEVVFVPKGLDLFQEDNLIGICRDAVASVAGSEPYTRRVLEACPNLRVIARTGVGFDAVDVPTCNERGIVVATTPGVNHHAVAEHTLAMLMALCRDFPRRDQQVRAGVWARGATQRIMGRTLGIVGLGRIGRAVATRAHGLGMKVVAADPWASKEFAEQWSIDLVSFDELLQRSDYVTLHSPATTETKHLMNARTLAQMKPGSFLINTARGALIDEPALIDALKSGHIRGAGLDVFDKEPLTMTSPLLQMDNVLLSGHVAGLDEESHHDTFLMSAETIISLREGRWPAECVRNPEGLKNWKW